MENSCRKDWRLLKIAALAVDKTSDRMKRATLEFLWDKFILQPQRDKKKAANAREFTCWPGERRKDE